MRSGAASALLPLALLACSRGGVAVAVDPEATARDLLERHVFDAPAELRPRFVPELDPANLPLRLVADAPGDYAFVDLWRLRMIDGRAVVTALFTLAGAPQLFDLWLERREGRWLVAGWERGPRPATPDAPAPRAGPEVPGVFAAPTFRAAAAPTAKLTFAGPAEPETAATVAVLVKAPVFEEGSGDATALRRELERRTPALRACYAQAFPGEARRGGRLTFTMTLAGGEPVRDVALAETTLLATGLAECVGTALGGVTAPSGSAGRARIALTFTSPLGARP